MVKYLVCSVMIFSNLTAISVVRGEMGKQIMPETLIGKYKGVIKVVKIDALEHAYQTEILSVNKTENTVSLSAFCADCGNRDLKRSDCKITESNEIIKFVCKGPTSDEEYTFNGTRLKATGFGNKYSYSINVTKID
jgi:hypothetical protein